jgi:hypothetical protein
VFDANSRPLLSNVLAQGVDGGGDRVVNSIELNRSRALLLRIKGIKYGDSGGGTYRVSLSGTAVNLAQGAAPNGGAAAPAGPNVFTGELDGTENLLIHGLSVTGPRTVKFTFNGGHGVYNVAVTGPVELAR